MFHSPRRHQYKIGRGIVIDRLNSGKTFCPDIRFVAAVQSGSAGALEGALHGYFAAEREGRSEWFEVSERVRLWVKWFRDRLNVASALSEVPDSYTTANLWPWYESALPEPSLADENGQALLDLGDLRRDYQEPPGRAARGRPSASAMTEDWYTNGEIVELIRELFGGVIDLDPFTCAEANRTVRAERIHTAETDGLVHTWHGKVLFNPPWSGTVKARAIKKLILEYEEGGISEAVAVLNAASTTTRAFAPMFAYPMCFPPRRITHWGPGGRDTSAITGTVLVYLGPDIARFAQIFSQVGNIVVRYVPATLTAESRGEDWDDLSADSGRDA